MKNFDTGDIFYLILIGLMILGVVAYITGCGIAYTKYGDTPVKDLPAWTLIYFQNRG